MKLISVVPISRGIPKKNLFYFTADDVEAGDLIEVPLRSRIILAKIDSVEDVSEAKGYLKSLPFKMSKISRISQKHFFSKAFMDATSETANYFCATPGATLHSLLPPKHFSSFLKFTNYEFESRLPEVRAIQSSFEDRISRIRTIIREEFARNKSILIILPTVDSVKRWANTVSKGIGDYVYYVHQRMPKVKAEEMFSKFSSNNHPVLMISTPQFVGMQRKDISTIILEEEGSRFYKKEGRPYIDFRFFIESYAKFSGFKLILSDLMLRVETVERIREGFIYEDMPASFRLKPKSEIFVSEILKENINKENDKVLKEHFLSFINSLDGNSKAFVLVPRRGISPYVFCGDCGVALRCKNCDSFMFLHSNLGNRVFLCHKCLNEFSAKGHKCEHCDSWNLKTFGLGSESVEEDIKNRFPDKKVFRLDKDSAGSEAKSEKIVKNFLDSPGSILVGTEMSLNALYEEVESVAVLSAESFSSIPGFSSEETALRMMVSALSKATKRFFIQTKDGNSRVISRIKDGNLFDFYNDELKDRKALSYPPYGFLIVLKWKGDENSKDADLIREMFGKYNPLIFSVLKEGKAVLKIEKSGWPNKDLSLLFMSLPSRISIEVNPENLF
jgi:primosomal protein N'